jgi:hypothetical protein
MGVYIKGMEMPEKCGLCDLFHAESPMHCTRVKGYKTVGAPYGMPRPDWCPLKEVKHGHWIDIDCQTYTWECECSECGNRRSMMSTQGKYPKFCEECGARMDG